LRTRGGYIHEIFAPLLAPLTFYYTNRHGPEANQGLISWLLSKFLPESRTQGKMFDGIFAHQRISKSTLRCEATFNQTGSVINPIDTKDTPMVKKRMPSVSTNQHSVIFPGMYVMKGVNARPASGAEKGTRAAHNSVVCLLIAFHK